MANHGNGFDVVVVGCGVAGLSAVISACEQEASVALSERATHEEQGCGTRYTEGFLRLKRTSAILPSYVCPRPARLSGHGFGEVELGGSHEGIGRVLQ